MSWVPEYGGTAPGKTNYKTYIEMKRTAFIIAIIAMAASCTWTETEPLEYLNLPPWEQEDWDSYADVLRSYKESQHKIAYGIFSNAPEKPQCEKDFMRSLPDSLDFVSLTDPDNLSVYDLEDLNVMRKKGIRVLFRIDYAGRRETDLGTKGAMEEYVSGAAAAIEELSLDGISFTGIPQVGNPEMEADATALIRKILEVKKDGQVLAFEGNPLFVPASLRSKIDYYILATENLTSISTIESEISSATGYIGIPARKIIVSAKAGTSMKNNEGEESSAIAVAAEIVRKNGTLAGFAVHDIGFDYYGTTMNYGNTRYAINYLNK